MAATRAQRLWKIAWDDSRIPDHDNLFGYARHEAFFKKLGVLASCCEAEVAVLFNLLDYQTGYLQVYTSSVVAIIAAYARLLSGRRRPYLGLF